MSLPILLILIGVVLAVLVSPPLGALLILVGLVLLVVPHFRGGATTRRV